ncbi:MAG: hypothetical protein NW226_16210 [Microscillaceae bacterium]|nr:hypothetical protein [Microscillaceae bacterium]
MKIKLAVFFWVFAVSSAYSQNTITLPGFGQISVKQNADMYTVNIQEFGSFDFRGSLKPLSLETEVSLEQLSKLPGYEYIQVLELEEMKLQITSDTLKLSGKADTQKKLKGLCNALNLKAPYIDFIAFITPKSMLLTGNMDFGASPVVVDVSAQTGTRFTLNKMILKAESGMGKKNSFLLSVLADMNIKPTSKDPDLASQLELSYNLLSTEIIGAGVIKDTWADPLGISQYLKFEKESISFTNTAVALGWLPAASVPSTLGFASEKAKWLDLDFQIAASVSPVHGEIALMAHNKEMKASDFIRMLEEGFGLTVAANLFPAELLFYDTDMLVSPNGGKVKDVEITRGFLLKGGVKLQNIMAGKVNLYSNVKDSLFLDIDLNPEELHQQLENKVDKEKGEDSKLEQALKEALAVLDIKKIFLHLEADKKNNLIGQTHCELLLFGKEMNFTFEGTLQPDKIMNNILLKISKIALEQFDKKIKKGN